MPSSEAPRSIGRYEIRDELGRGAMGVVYRAHDTLLGRDVALKTIRLPDGLDLAEQSAFEERFLREARVAARLAHPGIVVVHDAGRDAASDTLFMTLELLAGRSLDRVLKERSRLEWREALRLVERLAEALHHAHQQGVVHRDVKPANVMLLDSGAAKLTDFGIARVEASQLTASGQLFGTPLYMSPEQARGLPLDARSDVFSLGAVLYELVTGRRAFAGETVTSILLAVLSDNPEPPSAVIAALPEGLDYLVARCLAKDPADRFPDAGALAEDVADTLAGREPRHRAGWAGPAPGTGTLAAGASGALPVAVGRAPTAPAAAGASGGAPAAGSVPATPSGGSVAARASAGAAQPQLGRPWRLAAATAATLVLVVALVLVSPRPPAENTTAETTDSATDPGTAAATPDAAPSESPAPSGFWPFGREQPAELALDFEHSLRSGMLRVWVDEELAIEEDLASRVTRKIVGIKFRKGALEDTLELAPGRHEIKVEVRWDDNVQRKSAWANFQAGRSYRLEARLGSLGGLRKNLSLRWK